jgi:hypothetical protein
MDRANSLALILDDLEQLTRPPAVAPAALGATPA